MKIVREQYLRDDVWCGVKCCSRCCQTEPVLDAKPERSSSVFNFPYFIVPDTNIAVHQVCCMWYKDLELVLICNESTVCLMQNHRASAHGISQ